VQISLRSHLIAGTAAVVGASAIAMTPVMGAQLSLPSINVPTIADVSLAGFDSPITELLGTVIQGGNLLFNTSQAVSVASNWGPSAFFQPLPWIANPLNGGYSAIGLLPQIIDDALPIIRQLGINGSDYLDVAVAGLGGAGVALSEGVWNAAGQLLSLDIPGALATLSTAISDAGTAALLSGAYVLSGVVARAQAVLAVAVAGAGYVLGATVAQISAVVARTVQVVTDTFDALGTGNVEGAWNAAVDGIFGPSGVPGLIMNLTIGAGQQTAYIPPNEGPNGSGTQPLGTNFIPSTRMVVQSGVKQIADALATPVVIPFSVASAPAAAKKVGRSAASVRSAAAAVVAPAAEAPAAEVPAAEASAAEAPAPKPARKVSRAHRATAERG